MNAPTVYLISKNADVERIQQALSLTPLSAVIITDARSADFAKTLCDTVSNLQQPIAIVADFEDPLTAIDENGSLCLVL